MALQLNALRFENTQMPVFVILHGLLGSSRNWTTIGRALQERFDVHALDLRNHGNSPHAESMRWSELVRDLETYRESNSIESMVLLGHSLGGKIAARYACVHPRRVSKLVVVDIAAKAYPPYHDAEFQAMKRLTIEELENRKEAEALLEPLIPNWAMRQFILTNLVRAENGGFQWQVNLEALHASLPVIRLNSLEEGTQFDGPSLLLAGEKSDFVKEGDFENMKKWLPELEFSEVANAGHNVHVENRKGFLESLSSWL